MSHHLELAGRIDSGGGPELSSEFEWSSFFSQNLGGPKLFLNQNFSMGGPYLQNNLCGPKSSPKFEWAKTFIILKSIKWHF